jgi:hypothetical protein
MTGPAWVQKRDGTLVPFEADKISRALFAAGESLGRPDVFLARELADGVAHFLAAEHGETPPTTAQIAEIVVKIVRELGQPALAQAFADGAWVRAQHGQQVDAPGSPLESPRLLVPYSPEISSEELTAACLREFALREVYSRDLAAAHRDGLLTLTGLEAPFELAGSVLKPELPLFATIAKARKETGSLVALDGLEYAAGLTPTSLAAHVRELALALESVGLHAVVNLNCATPPSWAGDVIPGPLFADAPAAASNSLRALTNELVEALLSAAAPAIQVNWHLSENDLRPEAEPRLLPLAKRFVEGAALAFVFNRLRHPIALAAGIDRQHPAVLLTLQLHLPILAAQVAGAVDAPARFLHKLGSLVRLALSAGVQKREFLKRRLMDRPGLARGFLLDRARLIVAPVGLHQVVAALLGSALGENAVALEFARRVIERLRDDVYEDGRSRHLEVALDGALLGRAHAAQRIHDAFEHGGDPLRIAAALYDSAELGTLMVAAKDDQALSPDTIIAWLRGLWERSAVTRLCLTRAARTARQLVLGV